MYPPQHATSSAVVMTHVLLPVMERAFAVTDDPPTWGVTSDSSYMVCVPLPVSPFQFEPQHPTTSSDLMTHVCPYPAAIALTVVTPVIVTADGADGVVDPLPNCPMLPVPQHHGVSSDLMTHVW